MVISRRALLAAAGSLVFVRSGWACGHRSGRGRSRRGGCGTGTPTESTSVSNIVLVSPSRAPPLEKWRRVAVGMTERQVLDIIGEPIEKEPSMSLADLLPASERTRRIYSWKYGELEFPPELFPSPFEFQVYFSRGVVYEIEDPFGHEISADRPDVAQVAIAA